MAGQKRVTKRKFAHELYPHADGYEVRPLSVEVPYRYARFVGFTVRGTDWFGMWQKGGDPARNMLTYVRLSEYAAAAEAALLADALLQGLTGDEAWEWVESRIGDDVECVYDRARHYGIDFDAIKPYPILDEPDHHDHHSEPDPRGRRFVTRVEGRESECPDCTELVDVESEAE